MVHIGRRGLLAGAAGVLATTAAGPAAAARVREPAGPPGVRAARTAGGGRAGTAEFRGMWIATVQNVDWPSESGLSAREQRAELIKLLDTAVARRLNTVILQVRPAADAFWPSTREPWSQWLTGVQGRDPGWDPLGTAVTEAHARGLELHAWFNPYRVANHTDRSRLAASHPARRNPGWTVAYGGKLYYNPGLPEVRAFVQEAMLDAVTRYPVDAVHWDDYFYPYPVAGEYFDDDEAFAEHGGSFTSRAAWRRDNTDTLVHEMSQRLRASRPAVRFGISPFAVWRNQGTDRLGSATRALQTYDDLYADTRKWVLKGWVDYVVPQAYWHIGYAAADYAEVVRWWAQTVAGTGVDLYVGEALYRCDARSSTAAWRDPAELSRHLTLAGRYAEVRGHAYFSGKYVVADPNGALARVVADHYPTAVPPR
ncbi:family 10 glycosylhydrolase [Streptomyces sp. C]|uniref:glycoside hydrolase family 10 protein n=1 Tax=Streptomyces sp. C TaxID=253839 RepID=UPI0001B5419F|nr:family 10 glycosylhydrolase [Streptomyces sp. C]EFL14186.1 secreted protein [Streptomyces sp. C]